MTAVWAGVISWRKLGDQLRYPLAKAEVEGLKRNRATLRLLSLVQGRHPCTVASLNNTTSPLLVTGYITQLSRKYSSFPYIMSSEGPKFIL